MTRKEQTESAMRAIWPFRTYVEGAGLHGAPQSSIAEIMGLSASMIADTLHMVASLVPTDGVGLGDAPESGHERALAVIDRAFEMYLTESG